MCQLRYDRGVYRDCRWCDGQGCIFCPEEAEKAYKAQSPNGPQPLATFETTTKAGVAAARNAVGREALDHAFGPSGDGIAEIIRKCEQHEAQKTGNNE